MVVVDAVLARQFVLLIDVVVDVLLIATDTTIQIAEEIVLIIRALLMRNVALIILVFALLLRFVIHQQEHALNV